MKAKKIKIAIKHASPFLEGFFDPFGLCLDQPQKSNETFSSYKRKIRTKIWVKLNDEGTTKRFREQAN